MKSTTTLLSGLVAGLAEVAVLADLVEERPLRRLHVLHELLLERRDLGGVNLIQESSDSAIDGGDLLLDGHGDVLALLQQLRQPHAAVEQLLRGRVQVGAELREAQQPRGTAPA